MVPCEIHRKQEARSRGRRAVESFRILPGRNRRNREDHRQEPEGLALMDLRSLLTSTRYRLRTSISHVPSIYLTLADLRRRDEDGATVVTRATDLVVEAFPRSGNTF